jgi:hypothetical protein
MVKSPPPELGHLVRALNEAGGAYHHIDFGEGVALEGYYDLAPHLSLFDLPDEMEGLRVLDVGTFTGFLALECAARGAKVTAIDIHERSPVTDLAAILGLPVQYRQQSVFELAPGDGPYDLLVCGSLLLHLTDPVLALSRMRIVCGSALHVTTLCPKGRWRNRSHRLRRIGSGTGRLLHLLVDLRAGTSKDARGGRIQRGEPSTLCRAEIPPGAGALCRAPRGPDGKGSHSRLAARAASAAV